MLRKVMVGAYEMPPRVAVALSILETAAAAEMPDMSVTLFGGRVYSLNDLGEPSRLAEPDGDGWAEFRFEEESDGAETA